MSAIKRNPVSSLFGTKLQIDVGRGIAEFHARRPVLITDDGETLLALPVEGLDAQRLVEFMTLCAPVAPRLVITARRALALGLEATMPVALQLAVGFDADTILALVADAKIGRPADATEAGRAAIAAIHLVKLSQGLPAVLVAEVAAPDALLSEQRLVTVEAKAVGNFGEEIVRSLTIASKASAPLHSGSRADFVVFRDVMGGSSAAIIVGKPDFSQPVSPVTYSARGGAIAAISSNSRLSALKGWAAASFSIWRRRDAGLDSPTRCEPIKCRTMGSTPSTPT
jgi:GTP cyclohydrolase II